MDHRHDDSFDNPSGKCGRDIMGLELVVFATIFTLIVLLTGGPGPHA